jgi:DNA-binding NtrC family response regulator
MKKHILLIDNDEQELDYFLDALRNVPEEDGFKCTYARSVREAMSLLKKLVPHVIFVDGKLPIAETKYLLQRIKDHLHLREVKIFLYSCVDDTQPPSPTISLGLTGWVERSKSAQKLGRRIANCLAH